MVKRLETVGLVGEAGRPSLNSTAGGMVFCGMRGAGAVDRPLIADDALGRVGFGQGQKVGRRELCRLWPSPGPRSERLSVWARASWRAEVSRLSQVSWGAGGRCRERCAASCAEVGEQQSWEAEERAGEALFH